MAKYVSSQVLKCLNGEEETQTSGSGSPTKWFILCLVENISNLQRNHKGHFVKYFGIDLMLSMVV